MIRVTVKDVALKRGITKAYQLAVETGIHQSKAARLWNEEGLPNLATLGALCDAWGCSLGSLVKYEHTNAATPRGRAKKRIKLKRTTTARKT